MIWKEKDFRSMLFRFTNSQRKKVLNLELILKKNKPLIENYEDLKNRKLLQFTINGNEFSAENTKRFSWKRLSEEAALQYWTEEVTPSLVTIKDVYPNASEKKPESEIKNAIGFYKSREDIKNETKRRHSTPRINIREIEKFGEIICYGSFAGIDDVMLAQGLLNLYGSPSDEIIIQYSEQQKNRHKRTHPKDNSQNVEPNQEDFQLIGLNTILYGPPGTGKTYEVKTYKDTLLLNQSTSERLYNFEGLSWREAIYLAYKERNFEALSVKEIENTEVVRAYAKTKKSKSIYGTLSTTVIEHATEDSTTSTYRNGRDLFERIKDRWALTEAGKIEAEEVFSNAKEEIGQKKDYYYQFVTFHQSYGYEDFIEGIRAETVDGSIQYEVKKGVFRNFCERAEEDLENGTDNNFLFVIDEINRGNISKIFGELITLIEPEKRIGAAEEIKVTLPYSGDQFGIPKNVYILGTMNTADRSLAMMDTALRRRFDFVEMMPNSGLIRKEVGDSGSIERFNLADILDALNERIEYLYDREHTLGHAFFMNNNTLADVKRTFENKIIPLLQEYFYDDFRKIRAILNDKNGIYIVEKEISPNKLFDNKLADGFFSNNENKYALKATASDEDFKKFLSGVLIHKEVNEL